MVLQVSRHRADRISRSTLSSGFDLIESRVTSEGRFFDVVEWDEVRELYECLLKLIFITAPPRTRVRTGIQTREAAFEAFFKSVVFSLEVDVIREPITVLARQRSVNVERSERERF